MIFYLGLICILGGIYFLLSNFKVIGKKSEEQTNQPIEAKKIDNLLIRIASVILCLIGIYMIWPNSSDKLPSQSSGSGVASGAAAKGDIRVWSEELKGIITQQCLENGKRTAEEYPELVKDYCKCATDQISQAMTPDEYTQWMEKPKEEQAKIIRPIVQTCVDIMTKLIELTKETQPNKEGIQKK